MTHFTQLSEAFETATPEKVLSWAYEQFAEKLALVTSFQITGIVTIHMLYRLGLPVPVLTLDTGLLFPETYELMERLEARFDIEIQRIRPQQTVAEQAQRYGAELWARQPNRCCHYRKVVPLRQALQPYEAWITGIRRDQSPTRATAAVIGWDEGQQKVKLSPFARWTQQDVWEYVHAYNLPYNVLHRDNYPSIGCYTCTQPVIPGQDDLRAGRWAGQAKTECGIHLPAANLAAAGD